MKDNKKLRRGFTTGTCAAAAAQGAAVLALSGKAPQSATLTTPKGVSLTLTLQQDLDGSVLESLCPERCKGTDSPITEEFKQKSSVKGRSAICYIKKFSGDDPDVTNGILIFAKVTPLTEQLLRESTHGQEQLRLWCEQPQGVVSASNGITVIIDGGIGVGRVTKPGLACEIGQAAINPTPRKMIEAEVRRVAEELEYKGILLVEILIPQGVDIAKKTYNPRLGIQGGISVLGTSGIVEPMSEQALIDTIKVEMNMRCAAGAEYLLLTPGNYGETFLKETMGLGDIYTVKCSNFLGEALAYGEEKHVKGILLVSHIGKLIKVAGGIMNTHSKYGDARMEILSAHAAMQGAGAEVVTELMQCVTTDDGLAILEREQIREQTIASVLDKVQYHLNERTHHSMEIGAVMFSNKYGYLGKTQSADRLLTLL